MTHASRDTTTGLAFENKVQLHKNGINLTKHNLYRYLKEQGIDYTKIISKKLLPDEAYFDTESKEFSIYEKKYQQTPGSADEKPQTCAFKIWEYNKIGKAIGAEKITYTYIFNDWFKKPEYKDMLEYIRSVPQCDYCFEEEIYGN
jgi:hypothetical protein